MPDFENFLTAVGCRGEPKRVPQFDGSIYEDCKVRLLGRPIQGLADEVDFWMQAGYDYVPITLGLRQTIRGERGGMMGAKQVQSAVLRPAEAQYNPFAAEKTTRLWAEEGSGLIHDRRSFDDFPWPDPDAYDYAALDELGRLLPDGAKAIVNVGYVFMASWMLMGLENFLIALASGEPLVERVIRRVGEIQYRVAENVLEFDSVGAVRMPDDMAHTGGTLVAPRLLREHVFPWHKRIGERVRAKGVAYLLHSDGRLYDVLDDLVECGFQAVHPCEPASMDIERLKRDYGGRLCLCGNINLDSTLTRGTPEEVEEEVKLRIRTLAPGGGYCCGSSNSVPEYVPYENFLAMIRAIQRYGVYPIEVD